MIGVVDYQAGNLRSVVKALNHIQAEVCLVKGRADCQRIDRLILPGVGAFGSAIRALHTSGMFEVVANWLEQCRPFLGICLGMHMLCKQSEESGDVSGFARLPVRARRFVWGKVPQIGWNQVRKTSASCLLRGISDTSFFYFLHGYYVPVVPRVTAGITEYGIEYASVIEQGAACAVQFHPEKSGTAGLRLLRNWVELC